MPPAQWSCFATSLVAWSLLACGPAETDVRVSGEVTYPEYSAGDIVLRLVEDETEDCDVFSCSVQTPGETVARDSLPRPGAFSLSASVQGSTMHLLARALGDTDDEWACEAGSALSLSVGDHRDLEVELEFGYCPALD